MDDNPPGNRRSALSSASRKAGHYVGCGRDWGVGDGGMVIVGEPATRHQGGRELQSVKPLRWAWLVVSGSILAAVSLEVVVAGLTSQVVHGLGYPVFWVALIGCAVGTAGLVVSYLIEKGHQVPIEHWATGPACGAAISVLLGEAWLTCSHAALVTTGAIIVAVGIIVLVTHRANVSTNMVSWAVWAMATAVAVTASLWVVPDGLTLNFRSNNERQLDRLVPLANKLLATTNASPGSCRQWSPPAVESLFGVTAQLCGVPGQFYVTRPPAWAGGTTAAGDDWSLMFNSKGADTCERHLDGPWWETVGSGVTCPIGFNGVGGG